jgi:glycosyltransferase involved in cell wall biosynthesis
MSPRKRIAFVISHPIQYFAPLYQRLARRDDVEIKAFFTWHAGDRAIHDRGFGQSIAWDVPLTEGYDFELVPNVAPDPGTYGFFGLRNPALLDRVISWRPDVVHISGWAWLSHLRLLRALHRRGVPTLFYGDSHLLDGGRRGVRAAIKAALLRRVYSWPTGVLFVGTANRDYFERFGVPSEKLYPCPHSIDVHRFGDSSARLEQKASAWRSELGISPEQKVLLFAGKFEAKKRPVELMRALQQQGSSILLVMVGGGPLQAEIDTIARADPSRFRVLPFQNQSRMPVVYRLADLFVLPSAYGESWGLAVNEALACGRPVIVSDRVGCARDVVDATCGQIFRWNDWSDFGKAVNELFKNPNKLANMRRSAADRVLAFDIAVTEASLIAAISSVCEFTHAVERF